MRSDSHALARGTAAAGWRRIIVRAVAGAFASAAVLTVQPARAQVLEIGDDGSVRTRTGAGDVQWIGGPAEQAEAIDGDLPVLPAEAVTELAGVDSPEPYRAGLAAAAEYARVSPSLLAALVWQESRWRPSALSPKGAMGLTQLMPGTARALAIDPRDATANLVGGATYLRQMLDLFDGDVERALAAYNAGPARVRRAGGIPAIAETRAYVTSIINRLSGPAPDSRMAVAAVSGGELK